MSSPEYDETSASRLIRNPWVTGLLAVAELLLGFLLLGFPFVLGASAVWLCGFVLFAAALVRLVQCLSQRTHRWWNLVTALVYGAGALLLLQMPVYSLRMGTLGIGIALMLAGTLRVLMAAVLYRRAGLAWRLLNALVSLVLGLVIVASWPASSLWFLGTVITVEMIFSGWTLLFLTLAPDK